MQGMLESVSWTVAIILGNNHLDIESDDSSEFNEQNTISEQSEEERVSDDEQKEINFTGQHCFVFRDKVIQ